MEYPKIDSVFKRDQRGRFTDEYACPEFDFLKDVWWQWTEKVDGTNVRLRYFDRTDGAFRGNERAYVNGRTDYAQLPPKLLNACVALLKDTDLESWAGKRDVSSVTFYGEGYGGTERPSGCSRSDQGFVLFDVKIGEFWLRRPDVEQVAAELGWDVVPIVWECTLSEALSRVREQAETGEQWIESTWDGAIPEGVVGRPKVELFNRKGKRVTTKIKLKDFR